jgi:hypothetical protein
MASITLAGMQGDLYRQAHDLASRKREEYIDQTDLRQARANAERAAIARAERGALKKEDVEALDDKIRSDLVLVDVDEAAAQRVVDQALPEGSKIVSSTRDNSTGRISRYTIKLPNGKLVESSPNLLKIRAATKFQSTPQFGSAAATAQEAARLRSIEAQEKDRLRRQGAEDVRTEVEQQIIDRIKTDRNFREVQDPNGAEGDKIWIDTEGKRWTSDDQDSAKQQATAIAQGAAKKYYESGIKISPASAEQQWREQRLGAAKQAIREGADVMDKLRDRKSTLENILKSQGLSQSQAAGIPAVQPKVELDPRVIQQQENAARATAQEQEFLKSLDKVQGIRSRVQMPQGIPVDPRIPGVVVTPKIY